jgi:hypothetical protein
MHQSRLICLMKSLSKRELSQMEAFIAANTLKGDPNNLRLFRELRKFAPAYQHKLLEKKRFLAHWPKEGPWTEKQLSYYASKLTNDLEAFLAQQLYQKDEWQEALQLYRVGINRHLDYLKRKARRRIEKWLDQYPYHDHIYFRRQFEWAWLQYQTSDPEARTPRPLMQLATDKLDLYYSFEKIRHAWFMANQESMLQHEYDYGLGIYLQDWLKNHQEYLGSEPVLHIYWLAYQLTVHEKKPASLVVYQQLRALLAAHEHLLPREAVQRIYTGLLNFCTRRLNQTGDEHFRRSYFEINQNLLKKGWLLQEDGQLAPGRYLNLVSAGLALDETAWTKSFIGRYKKLLPSEMRPAAYHYVSGQYFYHLREYDEALKHLAKVTFKDPLFNATVRLLLTQIYYDAEEEELLHNQLEANRLFFLRDTNIEQERKKRMETFNSLLRRLARLAPFDEAGRQQLRKDIPGADGVLFRAWLLERI